MDSFLKQERDNEKNAGISYEDTKNIDATIETELEESTNSLNKLCLVRGITIQKLQCECQRFEDELNKTVLELETSRKVFRAVTGELKKQLDMAKQRESESQTKALGLRLENEKLQILLESKDGLVDRLKKELLSAKRTLKVAIKDICSAARLSDVTFTEADYKEFESSLHSSILRSPNSPASPRSPRVRFADALQGTNPPKKTQGAKTL